MPRYFHSAVLRQSGEGCDQAQRCGTSADQCSHDRVADSSAQSNNHANIFFSFGWASISPMVFWGLRYMTLRRIPKVNSSITTFYMTVPLLKSYSSYSWGIIRFCHDELFRKFLQRSPFGITHTTFHCLGNWQWKYLFSVAQQSVYTHPHARTHTHMHACT